MKCPTCGAENEASNRFCEQCGSRITPSGGFQPAQVAMASLPTAAGPTCPSCGAAVLPGEAFCDDCGASLSNVAPVAAPAIANDAPTLFAQPTPSNSAAPANDQNTTCPSCGHHNLPGDRFCDICGAELNPAAPAADATTTAADSQVPPSSSIADANAATAEQPGVALETTTGTPIESAPQAAAAAPGADANAAQSAYEAEKQRLNEEIERQQKIIEQFEQMQAMFGAAAPPAVVQGLSDARDARARAEAELAALTGGAAPAAASAPAPTAAEAPASAPTTAEAPATASAPEPAPATAAPAAEAPATGAPMPEPLPAPPQPAAVAAPRLVLDDGKELALPADKREIIIGREDPISGIFPEVDLTPYGGESGGVSRQHARLNNNTGQWTLTDLNSTNYTRVDGAKIEPNVPVPIAGGAKLQFGRVAMTFQV